MQVKLSMALLTLRSPLPWLHRSLFLKLGGEEVEYDPGFQLYLQTKLSNPHYKPEIAAQVRYLYPLVSMAMALKFSTSKPSLQTSMWCLSCQRCNTWLD